MTKIKDNRSQFQSKSTEACRVCGCSLVHSREYQKPTMDCIRFLRDKIEVLQDELKMPRP